MIDMPAIPQGEREYIAAVLWVHGRTLGEIAHVVGWTRSATKAFTGSLLPKARAHHDDAERAAVLAHFAANRRDGGRLKEEHFSPISLPGRKVDPSRADVVLAVELSWGECLLGAREIESLHERSSVIKDCHEAHRHKLREAGVDEAKIPDPTSLRGRREVREMERRALLKRKREEEAREQRELGGAGRTLWKDGGTVRNLSRALEYLFRRRMLADGKATSTERHSEETRRYEAGERLQRYIDGARIATLGALDMEKASMGTNSSKAMTLSWYRLYCAQTIGAISKMMGRADYAALDAVIDQDAFTWERFSDRSVKRAAELERIRRSLDIVAVYENLMSAEAFAERWGTTLTMPGPDAVPSRHGAARQADLAAELIESAR